MLTTNTDHVCHAERSEASLVSETDASLRRSFVALRMTGPALVVKIHNRAPTRKCEVGLDDRITISALAPSGRRSVSCLSYCLSLHTFNRCCNFGSSEKI